MLHGPEQSPQPPINRDSAEVSRGETPTGQLTAREKRVLILGGAAVAVPVGDALIFTDNQLRAGGAGLTENEWLQLAEQGAIDARVIPLDQPIAEADSLERRNAV